MAKKYIESEKDLIKEITKQNIGVSIIMFMFLMFFVSLFCYFSINEGIVSMIENPIALFFLIVIIIGFLYFFIRNFSVVLNPRKKSDTYIRFNENVKQILDAIKDVNDNTIYQDGHFKMSKDNICLSSYNSNIINYNNFSHSEIVTVRTNGVISGYDLRIYDKNNNYIMSNYSKDMKENIDKIILLINENFIKD